MLSRGDIVRFKPIGSLLDEGLWDRVPAEVQAIISFEPTANYTVQVVGGTLVGLNGMSYVPEQLMLIRVHTSEPAPPREVPELSVGSQVHIKSTRELERVLGVPCGEEATIDGGAFTNPMWQHAGARCTLEAQRGTWWRTSISDNYVFPTNVLTLLSAQAEQGAPEAQYVPCAVDPTPSPIPSGCMQIEGVVYNVPPIEMDFLKGYLKRFEVHKEGS